MDGPPNPEGLEALDIRYPKGLHLRVLGRVEVVRDGVPIEGLSLRRKPLAVLAYLALADRSVFVQRDFLCGIFWPDSTQNRARASLRQALAVIRGFLPDVFEFRGDDEVRLRSGAMSVDFDELRAATRAGSWVKAAELAREDPFRGFHIPRADGFEDWISGLHLEMTAIRRELSDRAPAQRVSASGVEPEPSRRSKNLPNPPAPEPRSRIVRRVAAVTVAVVLIGLTVVVNSRPDPLSEAVAVSSPEFLGASEDGAHLARGLQEEMVGALSGIEQLTVVPVGAIRRARRGGESGLSLARALDARYELRASIQMEGDAYRVTMTFVDWASESVVWSESFQAAERGMLDLRADARSRVTNALAIELGDTQLRHVGVAPEAMPHYLLALGLMGIEGTDVERHERWHRAAAQLDSAVTAAPDFAAGWARKALLGYRQFWLGGDPTWSGIQTADEALDKAIELQPDGREVRLAQAYQAYHLQRDWQTASMVASGIVRRFGANPDVVLLWAMSERRQGNLDAAIEILANRLTTHPLEYPTHGRDLFSTYERAGRFDEADELLARIEAIEGRWLCPLRYERAFHRARSMAEVDRVVEECRSRQPGAFDDRLGFWHEFRMRRFDSALSVIDSIVERRRRRGVHPPDWFNQQWAPYPVDLWRGLVYQRQGEQERARSTFAAHIPELERLVAEFPELSLRRRFLATAYAGSGSRDLALQEARKALELSLAVADHWAGIPGAYQTLMLVLADLGKTDEAIGILDDVLTSGSTPHIGLNRLLLDPQLDVLRASERYARVVAKVEATVGQERDSR